jgi:hypothetical protein
MSRRIPLGNRRLSKATRRRAVILAVLTAASCLFALATAYPLRLIPLSRQQAIVLVVLAVIALVGALLRLRGILLGLGIVTILLGLARLIAGATVTALVPGGVGTASFLVGLGIAYLGVALADRRPSDATERD